MSKLFQKAKLAVKFRRAGEGHVLSESSSSTKTNQPKAQQEPRKAQSSDAQRAGQVCFTINVQSQTIYMIKRKWFICKFLEDSSLQYVIMFL